MLVKKVLQQDESRSKLPKELQSVADGAKIGGLLTLSTVHLSGIHRPKMTPFHSPTAHVRLAQYTLALLKLQMRLFSKHFLFIL